MKIQEKVDRFLNNTPMYKLVLYVLYALVTFSFVESLAGKIDFSPLSLLGSLVVLFSVCVGVNFLFAKALKLPVQYESSVITALILYLILVPLESAQMLYSLLIAGTFATVSKYLFVHRNTHIFNPAAVGLFAVTALGFGSSFWWVGNLYMFPLVLVGGYLIVRKTRREALTYAALLTVVVTTIIKAFYNDLGLVNLLSTTFLSGPVLFFIFFMLTEPYTIATTKRDQIFYAIFVLLLPTLSMLLKLPNISPELTLLMANILSFVASYRTRMVLKLKKINQLNSDTFEYYFELGDNKPKIIPGQYAEWSLPNTHVDDRGMRRYLTISDYTDNTVAFATKFPPEKPSAWKERLRNMVVGETIYATQIGGDFILPENKSQKLVFIAGGIGVTPFISHLRYLMKKDEQRDVTLFYCAKSFTDVAYLNFLKELVSNLNLKLVFVLNSVENKSDEFANLNIESGYFSKEVLQKYVPDCGNCIYYASGPNIMVDIIKNILKSLDVKSKDIHTDYFPGF